MNKIIIEPKQHNGRWYRIINVVDFIVDETYPSYYELEFVKVQMKIDFVLFKVWFTIKSYRVTENHPLKNQITRAKRLLNTIIKD